MGIKCERLKFCFEKIVVLGMYKLLVPSLYFVVTQFLCC